jgi:hypothetical protein
MAIRLSHSARGKYLSCGHSYYLHYIQKWRGVVLSSALGFGSAVDVALNYMLENKDQDGVLHAAMDIFDRHWEQIENNAREKVDAPLNPNLKYSRYDFDNDLLDKSNYRELFKYDPKFFETKTRIDEDLKAKKQWLDIPEEDRMVYNYANWICMQKKGHLLLTAYYKEILPQIKKVLAVQMTVELDDGDGNILNGVIDAVIETHDGRVLIMDNKTSSTEYDENSVPGSEQLATYYSILNIFNEDPDHSWKHKIDGACYAVMSKKLQKTVDKVCKSCGHISTGAHKTCDALDEAGERCNGAWDKTVHFAVKTQFITGNISEQYAEEVLNNASTVKSCIEAGLFPKNYSACENIYGGPCVYLSKCHGGSDKGLIKLESK